MEGGANRLFLCDLNEKSKRRLMQFFNEGEGTNFNRITQVKKYLKITGETDKQANDETYELLRINWNDYVEQERTQEYIQEYIIDFDKQFTTKSGVEITTHVELPFNVIGKKKDLARLIKKDFLKRKEEFKNKYPLISAFNFKYTLGDKTPIQQGGGIQAVKMKSAGSFILSTETANEWDTNSGKCVIDYLVWLYGDVKGFKKIANYDNLYYEFPNWKEGISILDIDVFCRMHCLSYYALDSEEELIKFSVAEKKTQGKALVFRIINGHIYPIDDFKRKMSIVDKATKKSSIVLRDKDIKTREQDEKPVYDVIIPTTELLTTQEMNTFALEQMDILNTFPYPISSKNFKFEDGKITRLILNNKLVLTEKPDDDIVEYLKTKNRPYQGENVSMILRELWTQTYGNDSTIYANNLSSNYNPIVSNILTLDNVKNRTHYGAYREVSQGELYNAISCDIEKCYSSLVLKPLDDWLVFGLIDELTHFTDTSYYDDKQIKLEFGLYAVETDDLEILHKSNIYSNLILDYAKMNGVKFKIIYQIVKKKIYDSDPSFNNKDYFHKLIETIRAAGISTALQKTLINTITGCLGKTNSKTNKVGLTTKLEEVWENNIIKKLNKEKEIYFKKLDFKHRDESLYIFGETITTAKYSNNLPQYIQILDWSNINLHKMRVKMGGELIFRKTDCCVVLNGQPVEEKGIKCKETWGSFRNEDPSRVLKYNYGFIMSQDRHVIIPTDLIKDWKTNIQLNSSSQFKDIIEYAVNNRGLLIQGRAGTGKSYIISEGVKQGLIENDIECRLAFTNKASRNINGTTIHKALGIDMDGKITDKMLIKYGKKKIVFIDEIGMITADLWKKLVLLKKTHSSLTFILMGEHRQCGPIEEKRIDKMDYNYFNSSFIKYLAGNSKIELTERQRYDKEMWDWLEDFYERGIEKKLQKHYYNLTRDEMIYTMKMCYLNSTRDNVNDVCINTLKPENSLFIEHTRKNIGDKGKSIYIYKGLPIMCIKNIVKLDIINTDTFIVDDYNNETITLRNTDTDDAHIFNISTINDGKQITKLLVEGHNFHSIFVANYISTTHKNQGATVKNDIIIYDWELMDKHVAYTAISRAKSLGQIRINEKSLINLADDGLCS